MCVRSRSQSNLLGPSRPDSSLPSRSLDLPRPTHFRAMAWLARTRCTLSEASCAVLLKAHVSGLDDGAFVADDPEQLLVRYAGFLAAAAGQTVRLKSSVVEKAAVTVFCVSAPTARKFGQSMAQAMAYAYGKGCKATSGRKLSDAVKTVCLGFRCEAMGPLQRALASPSRLGAVKQEASESQDPEPGLPLVASPSAGSGMSKSEIAALYGVSPAQEAPTAGPVEIVSSQDVPSQDLHSAPKAQVVDPVPKEPKRRRMREKGKGMALSLPAFVKPEGGDAFSAGSRGAQHDRPRCGTVERPRVRCALCHGAHRNHP